MIKTSSSGQFPLKRFLYEFAQFVAMIDSFLSLILHVDSALGSILKFTMHNTYSKVILG